MQNVEIPRNEGFLLGARPLLELDFALAGLVHSGEALGVDQSYRAAAGGEAWAMAFAVRFDAGTQVRGRTDIVRSVGASEDINEEAVRGLVHLQPGYLGT